MGPSFEELVGITYFTIPANLTEEAVSGQTIHTSHSLSSSLVSHIISQGPLFMPNLKECIVYEQDVHG